jgi:hypothetical protein
MVREEWKSKVRSVENNLGAAAAKFDAGLLTLVTLQQQLGGTPGLGIGMGIGNGDVVKGFHGSRGRWGGLVMHPSLLEREFELCIGARKDNL